MRSCSNDEALRMSAYKDTKIIIYLSSVLTIKVHDVTTMRHVKIRGNASTSILNTFIK